MRMPLPRFVERDFESHANQNVTLVGRLEGPDLVSWWPAADLDSPVTRQTRYQTTRVPQPPRPQRDASVVIANGHAIVCAGGRVELEGPLQVVLANGVSFTEPRKIGRIVRTGMRVKAEGRLERSPDRAEGEAGYRERPIARFVLRPQPAPDWPDRPIAIYEDDFSLGKVIFLVAMMLFLVVVFGGGVIKSVLLVTDAAKNAPVVVARSDCAGVVDRYLAAGDVVAAYAAGSKCSDGEAHGHAAFMFGKFEEAATAFAAARAKADFPLTFSEVESALIANPKAAAPMLARLEKARYDDDEPAQRLLHCISADLLPRVGADSMPVDRGHRIRCSTLRDSYLRWDGREDDGLFHRLPAYALHDPTTYHPSRPTFAADMVWTGPVLVDQSGPFGRARMLAVRLQERAQVAVFAALTADNELLRNQLPDAREVEPVLKDLERSDPEAIALEIQQAMSVFAAAVWHSGDEVEAERLAARGEAHARAIMDEQIALERGKLLLPAARHSPSDYSPADMELFTAAQSLPAAAFVERLRNTRFRNPARLAALIKPSQRGEQRELVASWIDKGFYPLPVGGGFHSVLSAHFERRSFARIAESTALETQLAEITRRFSEAAQTDAYPALLALEGLARH